MSETIEANYQEEKDGANSWKGSPGVHLFQEQNSQSRVARRTAKASPKRTLEEWSFNVTARIIFPKESLIIATATAKLQRQNSLCCYLTEGETKEKEGLHRAKLRGETPR